MTNEFEQHWTANGESDIFRRLPKMRRDELERLARMLDTERATNTEFFQERKEVRYKKQALENEEWHLEREKKRLEKVAALIKGRIPAARSAARRKALQDVCDVLNYERTHRRGNARPHRH